MGQLVSDGSRDYVWVTDKTNRGDVIQNLNLAVSDPAGQPDVTAVGGTSLGHGTQTLGPPPTETGLERRALLLGGGRRRRDLPDLPHAGVPAGARRGEREQWDAVRGRRWGLPGGPRRLCGRRPEQRLHHLRQRQRWAWNALGGTSGAAPLWAAVVAVVASANGNTAGYGQLNPALYLLAQQSPSTYLNDVTSGNNDYNATAGGQYPAMPGYDMATGLGTPVASALATGLASMPLSVTISGSQTYGGSPTFIASAKFAGTGTAPFGVTLDSSGLTCSTVGTSTAIGPDPGAGAVHAAVVVVLRAHALGCRRRRLHASCTPRRPMTSL